MHIAISDEGFKWLSVSVEGWSLRLYVRRIDRRNYGIGDDSRAGDKRGKQGAYIRSAEEFHRLFKENFGATCCRILNPHPFDSKDHLRIALRLTGKDS